jgi:DNA-binding response OmpR family regulator
MRVLQSNEYIDLLPKEFSLLEFFMRNPDRVFTAQAIMERVWKFETEATTDAFRSALKRLRRKIDRPDHKTPLVETVHGSGYRFNSAD